MILLEFNMYQTLFLAVISVSIGGILRKKRSFCPIDGSFNIAI